MSQIPDEELCHLKACRDAAAIIYQCSTLQTTFALEYSEIINVYVPVPSSFEASKSDCSELLSLSVQVCGKAVLRLVLVALKSTGLMQWNQHQVKVSNPFCVHLLHACPQCRCMLPMLTQSHFLGNGLITVVSYPCLF